MPHQRIRLQNTRDGTMFPDLDYTVSGAVRAGNNVFLQGQTGITLDGESFVGRGDPAAQADNAMSCVKVLLEEVGARIEDICKITTYVTDASYRPQIYPVLARHLGGTHPSSTGLVVKALAEPHIDFELDVFAVVPESRPQSQVAEEPQASHLRFRKGDGKGSDLLRGLGFRGSSAVKAGRMVYVTGATGIALDSGEFVGEGDPAAQADNAMRVVRALLEETGSRMEDICKVVTYVTKHSYRKDVYPVLSRHLKGISPVSTGLVITALAAPVIDFEIDVFSVIPEEGKEHRRIGLINTNTPEAVDPAFPGLDHRLARAVRAGDLVYLQGQTGRTFDGGFVGKGDPAAQADNAMRCVKTLLEEVGARMEDICKVTTYVKDVSFRQSVYPVLAEHLKGVSPVSTGLVVEDFGHPDVDFEIDVFASVPEDRA